MAFENLSAAQKEAASHSRGPALTLAGPGSGKTTVLMERTIRLVRCSNFPERILSVTFTNAAGEEMRGRYRAAWNALTNLEIAEKENLPEPVFQTVHSFCNGMIRSYEIAAARRYQRIEGEVMQKAAILQSIYRDICGEPADATVLRRLMGGIQSGSGRELKHFHQIQAAYQQYKIEHFCIDFDDMITLALDILTSNDAAKRRVREEYQEKFTFIQVDEAQDLTQEQFEVIRAVGVHKNIFVVADDDQSIYGFRGAAPSCIRTFYQSEPDCKLYHLVRNYRSVKSIVELSDMLIQKNTERFEKKLYSEKEEGILPHIKVLPNAILQAEFVYRQIWKLIAAQNTGSVGILYRNHLSSLVICAYFRKQNLGFHLDGEMPMIMELPFLPEVLQEIRNAERTAKFWIPQPLAVLKKLLADGLEKEMERYCRKTGAYMRDQDGILSLIWYLCSVCGSYRELVRFLDQLDSGGAKGDPAPCQVFLSTIHSAKGLEYDAVFLIDVFQGEFPGSGATSGALLEEERRLFYVAMTRARSCFYALYPLYRGNLTAHKAPLQESIFIKELRGCMEKRRKCTLLDEKRGSGYSNKR